MTTTDQDFYPTPPPLIRRMLSTGSGCRRCWSRARARVTSLGANLPNLTAHTLLAEQWCRGLVQSRQPDLDRETAAIDAARETATS